MNRYYVSVSLANDTRPYYYCYNVLKRRVEQTYLVSVSLDNAEYDRNGNRLVGTVNDVLTFLYLNNGKMVTMNNLNFSKIGFRQLGASSIDTKYYYVFYENHLAQSFFVKVDLENYTYEVNQVYDLIGTMVYLPNVIQH